MVRAHQLDGRASEDPCRAERTARRQHLAEAGVVVDRADEAAAARLQRRFVHRRSGRPIVDEADLLRRPSGIQRRHPIGIRLGGVEAGVVHAQRVEDGPLQVVSRTVRRRSLRPAGRRCRTTTSRTTASPAGSAGARWRAVGSGRRASPLGSTRTGRLAAEEALHVEAGALRAGPIPVMCISACLTLIGRSRSTRSKPPLLLRTLTFASRHSGRNRWIGSVELDAGLLDERQEGHGGDRFGHRVPAPDGLIVELLAATRGPSSRSWPDAPPGPGGRPAPDSRRSCRCRRTWPGSARRCVRDARRRSPPSARGDRRHECRAEQVGHVVVVEALLRRLRTWSAWRPRTWPAGPCRPRGAGSRWRT